MNDHGRLLAVGLLARSQGRESTFLSSSLGPLSNVDIARMYDMLAFYLVFS